MSILPVGPTDAKTSAWAPAARLEISAPARLTSATLSASPWLSRVKRFPPKVLVMMTWLPAPT